MILLNPVNREQLEARGFDIAEMTGFNDHWLPLYTHRQIADKQPGDVVVRARVGNPQSLDDGEASYLARKAFHGLFPWTPGAECMKRTFANIGPGTVSRDGAARGCRWCQQREANRGSLVATPPLPPDDPALNASKADARMLTSTGRNNNRRRRDESRSERSKRNQRTAGRRVLHDGAALER